MCSHPLLRALKLKAKKANIFGEMSKHINLMQLDKQILYKYIDLLNTILLLSSGAFITYAHHALLAGDRKGGIEGTLVTIWLAILFTALQYYEYVEAPFTITDSVFGSAFFASTGLHGLHVIVGTTFILVGLIRMINYHFSTTHHLGFEAAILYWHFVDVVWLFLFIAVYYWGTN